MTPRPIKPLEETPRNALAYLFVMSTHLGEHHDDLWVTIQNAVHGVGYLYEDVQDQTCPDCCRQGYN